MNEQFASGCEGKTDYAERADALRVIRLRDKEGRNRPRNGRGCLEPYRCRFCKHWHIGSRSI
jgi:hypothetical protein